MMRIVQIHPPPTSNPYRPRICAGSFLVEYFTFVQLIHYYLTTTFFSFTFRFIQAMMAPAVINMIRL
jgi:hypothetical protein